GTSPRKRAWRRGAAGRLGARRLADASQLAKPVMPISRRSENGRPGPAGDWAAMSLAPSRAHPYLRGMDHRSHFYLPHSSRRIEAPLHAQARFAIGDVVRHRLFDFRGVVFDIDPVF